MIEAIKNGAVAIYDSLGSFVTELTSTDGSLSALLPVVGIVLAIPVISFAVGLVRRICNN